MPVQRDHPYGNYNFLVEIDGVAAAGFQEVSGLSVEIDVIAYRDGSDRTGAVRRMPGLHKVPDVTLKRGVAGQTDLYDWLRAVINGQAARRNIAISLLPEDRSGPVARWKLFNAFPVRFTLGPLNAKGTDVAMEELVLAAERLEIA